jgi:hypothetical protein
VPLFSRNPGGIEGYWSAKAVAGGQPGGCGSRAAIGAGEGGEIPDLYRELARASNLTEELQRAESEDAWIKAGVDQLCTRTSNFVAFFKAPEKFRLQTKR